MKLFLLAILGLAAMTAAEDKSVEELFNEGNNKFTAKMFSEVVKKNPGKSVVLSAYSVLTPLAQLSIAADGASHDELLRAIGLPNDNVTKEAFTLANSKFRAVKGVELKMASRVYIPENYELNDKYLTVSRDVFGSDVKNVDFSKNVATAGDINTWVEDQTNHRIKDLVSPDSLDATTRAVLVNAIYFKGTWQDKFLKEATTDRDFHVTKEQTIKVPTMYRKGEYKYAESEELNAKLLQLPYEGGEASMLIILPNEIDGLSKLEEKLKDPEAITRATEKMSTFEVDVYLPKFKIETTTNLKEVLMNIDVKKIFQGGEAQLNNLLKGESDLYISEAIQKAFIEVNEEGAEAAAANAFVGVGSAAPNFNPRKIFDANKPFYFGIDASNNNKIFTGVYSHFDTFIGFGSAAPNFNPRKIFDANKPFYFEIDALSNNKLFTGVNSNFDSKL